MLSTVPDVVSDNVTDAAKRLGCTVDHVFLRAAENCRNGRGFSNNNEVGEHLYRTWVKEGYRNLPPAIQVFILECNEGQHNCPECGSNTTCHHFH